MHPPSAYIQALMADARPCTGGRHSPATTSGLLVTDTMLLRCMFSAVRGDQPLSAASDNRLLEFEDSQSTALELHRKIHENHYHFNGSFFVDFVYRPFEIIT